MLRSLFLTLTILLLTSCAGTEAPLGSTTGPASGATISLPHGAPGLFGLYTLAVGVENSQPVAELTPLRETQAFGDAFALDASRYFTGNLCGDCVRVTGIGLLDPTTLDIAITIKHPFAMPTPPLRAADRVDLHIFDVAGMVVSNIPGATFPGIGIRPPAQGILNPMGYSGVFDPALERIFPTPAVDVHPYRMYNVDTTAGNFAASNPNGFADVLNPSGHNVFPQGGSATEHYQLRFPNSNTSVEFDLDLLFVITASWGQGASGGPGTDYLQRGNPAYFLPAFNQQAAWQITTSPLNNNTLAGGNTASTAELPFSIADWQWGTAVDIDFPNVARLDHARVQSEPQQITIDVPGVLANAITVSPASGTGSGAIRSFTATITNSAGGAEGTYPGLIQVIDSIPDAQGIAQDDPTPVFLGQLATYQTFSVDVGPGGPAGPFGTAVLISDRLPASTEGNFNVHMPELVSDGTDLFLGYQGPNDEAVIARSSNGGMSFTNSEVYQGAIGALMDPTVGVQADGTTVHLVLAAPDEAGMYDAVSLDNGGSWSDLLVIHDDGFNPDESQSITSGDTAPAATYGSFRFEGDVLSFILGSATWNGVAWDDGSVISDLKPHTSDSLIRVDETPMLYRMPSGNVVCLFGSNERGIAMLGDDFPSEPVAVRSTNGGATWQDWSHVHAFNATGVYDTLTSCLSGSTLLLIESSASGGAPVLFRSIDEGLNWSPGTLPATLTGIDNGLVELAAGLDGRVAVVWATEGAEPEQLLIARSVDGGMTWDTPVACDDDPTNNFDVFGAAAAYTSDGRVHIAFTDNRPPGIRWRMVSSTS